MRYYREARFRLMGTDAKLWINEGRKRLGILINSMNFQRLMQLSQRIQYPDGTEIFVSSIFGQQTVEINTTGAETQELVLPILESGYLWFEPDPVYPARIAVGGDVAMYASSAGTPIPGSSKSEFLNGNAETTEDPAAPGACANFPDEWTPDITNSFYESEQYLLPQDMQSVFNDSRTYSSRYTGNLRLCVQSKVGAARSIDEIVPSLFESLAPGTDGLIRTSSYQYFFVRVTAGGAWATRLVDDLECVREWLVNASTYGISDDDKIRFEAYLMSTLTVELTDDGIPVIFQVATAPQLENTYNGREPLCHGWAFAYGDTSEASIVTWKIGDGATNSRWYWETTLSTITFTFSESQQVGTVPTALVSSPEQDIITSIRQSTDWLWYPQGGGGNTCLQFPPGNVFTDPGLSEQSPVYAFYNKGSALQVLRYKGSTVVPLESNPITPNELPPMCSPGTQSVDRVTERTEVNAGGFFFSGGPSVIGDISDTYKYEDYEMSYESSGGTFPILTGDHIPCGMLDCCGATVDECDSPVSVSANYSWATGSGNAEFTVNAVTESGGHRIAIIAGLNPEAVYMVELEYGREDYSVTEYHTYELGDTGTYSQLVVGVKPKTGGSITYGAVTIGGFHTDLCNVCIVGGGGISNCFGESDVISSSTSEFENVVTAVLVTSSQTIELSDVYGDWSGYAVKPDPLCSGAPFVTPESFNGGLEYYFSPTEPDIVGYPVEMAGLVGQNGFKRWVGWA